MLLAGINHVAVITNDTDRLHAFYGKVFDAEVTGERVNGDTRFTVVKFGPHSCFNVFEVKGNTEADRQVPMLGRGRLDHVGFEAESAEAFETIRQRLVEAGASDGQINHFGDDWSVFFRDPDGLECELCLRAQPK
jgi:catechol 2,3-dioxygenase-like lactoylglutathione lyase family enzyme